MLPDTTPAPFPARRKASRLAWIVGALAAALLLAVGAIFAVLLSIDPHRYADQAARLVTQSTGREFKVAGAVRLSLSLSPRIVMENLSFANVPWGSRPEMVRMRRAELEIALLPLLRGEVHVVRLALIEPDILLERDRQGRGNWEFTAASPAPAESGQGQAVPAAITIGGLDLENAKFILVGRAEAPTELLLQRVSARSTDAAGNELQVELTGRFNSRRIAVQGTLGGPAAFLADRPWPVRLAAEIDGAKATVSGQVARPRELAGLDLSIDIGVSDGAAAGAFLGASPPPLPPLRVTARLRDEANGGFRADSVAATVGDSQIAGGASISRSGQRPRVDLHLASALLDLSFLAAGRKTGQRKPQRGDGRIFPAEPLPLGGFGTADGEAELNVDRLILPGGRHTLEGLQLRAKLEAGRLTLDPAKFSSAGGRVSARIEIDASSGKTVKLAGRIDGGGLALGALMAMIGRPQSVQGGRTDLHIEASASGNSVRALMAGVSGRARVTVGEAKIEGKGLDWGADVLAQVTEALNPTLSSDPSMHLECMVLNVPVRNGVVTLDKGAAAETSKVGIIAQGTVDLGTEVLDFAARSKARQGIGTGLANFSGVARVEGTLAHPRLGVDVRGAAEAVATVGAALSTGGLSLLYQGLFNKAFPDHPCRDALAGASVPTRASAPRAPAKKKEEPGWFQRLFGK